MARSKKKLPFVSYALLQKVKKWKVNGSVGQLKTWSRRSTIYPEFVGITFHVHNGKAFMAVSVTEYGWSQTRRVCFNKKNAKA